MSSCLHHSKDVIELLTSAIKGSVAMSQKVKSIVFGETPCAANPFKRLMVALASALCLVTGAWADKNLNNVIGSSLTIGNGETVTGTLGVDCNISVSAGAEITLSGVTINRTSSDKSYAGLNCLGNATIILDGPNTVTNTVNGFGGGYPGIYVKPGYTLTIKGSGTLNAMGNSGGAGIGGGKNINSGNIVIEGSPTINATGTYYGAGIGGGKSSTCGTITIKGGTITARGNLEGGAGIGGGGYGTCDNIRIEGGTVWAYGGYNTGTGNSAPGIGSGDYGTCGTITITTGITAVRALRYNNYSTDYIGKGLNESTCGTVTIPSGLLDYNIAPDSYHRGRAIVRWDGRLNNLPASTTAVTAFDGTTITGELKRKCKITIAADATVALENATIDGASLNSPEDDDYSYAGITCEGNAYIALDGNNNTVSGFHTGYPGIYVPQGSYLVITGNGTLTATGNGEGAGIGGGYGLDCGEITLTYAYVYIDGKSKAGYPTVIASGGRYSAGIGGGYNASCGKIWFWGAQAVTATGGENAAGIGSGYSGSCDNIEISSPLRDKIEATGYSNAEPIGAGYGGTCGDVKVHNSFVDVTNGSTRTIKYWNGDLSNLESDVVVYTGKNLTGTLSGNHKISIANGALVTLENAVITNGVNSSANNWAGLTCLSNATITLVGENKIKGFYEDYPGIYVPPGSTLTIKGGGSLDASTGTRSSGVGYAAGIGAGYNYTSGDHPDLSCGNIVINGGNITATGGSSAAGIGGGHNSSFGDITIGSDVLHITATGGSTTPIGAGGGSIASLGTVTVDSSLYDETRYDETSGHVRDISSIYTESSGGVTWNYCILFGEARICNKDSNGNPQTAYSGTPTGAIAIPATLGGKPVTVIGDLAVANCDGITSVTIPDSVKTIGKCAFAGCTSLASVTFGSGLETIGIQAFQDCAFTEIVIPEGVTAIYKEAFWCCYSLTDVMLPDSLDIIGDTPFKNCNSLETVYVAYGRKTSLEMAFPELEVVEGGFATVGGYKWYYCFNEGGNTVQIARTDDFSRRSAVSPKPTGAVSIPATLNGYPVTDVGICALFWCTDVTDVTIGDGVVNVRTSAFAGCTNLVDVAIGSNVTNIDESAFTMCYNLAKVELPASVANIGRCAFDSCSKLKEVYFPALATVGENAFRWCNSLETIYIPDSVNINIMLQRLTASGLDLDSITVVTTGHSDTFDGYTLDWNNVNPPGADTDYYVELVGISPKPNGAYTIPSELYGSQVKAIGAGMFDGCSAMTEVTIPDGVTEIGLDAFADCANLQTVNVGIGRTDAVRAMLEASGFDVSTVSFVEPIYTETIGDYTWYFVIDNNEATIYNGEVTEAVSPKPEGMITIPDTLGGYPVTGIGNAAFGDCTGLTGVTIPNGVRDIGVSAFAYCSSLTKVVIPATVTSIDSDAFYSTALATVYVTPGRTETVQTMLASSLLDTSGITFVDGGFETDEDGFTWYYSFVSRGSGYAVELYRGANTPAVEFPEDGDYYADVPETLGGYTVVSIGEYAFYHCSNLMYVNLTDNVTSIKADAFAHCSSLDSVWMPEVTSIGAYAFYGCPIFNVEEFPAGLTSIGANAFYGCSNLGYGISDGVIIPDGVTVIGFQAFYGCTSLQSLRVGTLSAVGNEAFVGAPLETVYVPVGQTVATRTKFNNAGAVSNIGGILFIEREVSSADAGGKTWYYRLVNGEAELFNDYDVAVDYDYESEYVALEIPGTLDGNTVTRIGYQAFGDCSNLAVVNIPASVTRIGEYAFVSCYNLATVMFGDSTAVTEIAEDAFYATALPGGNGRMWITGGDRSRVKGLLVASGMSQENVDTIKFVEFGEYQAGDYLMTYIVENDEVRIDGCTEYPELGMSNGYLGIPQQINGFPVTSIGSGAFDGCTSITSLRIPEYVKTIEASAFMNCESLEEIEFTGDVEEIAGYAFAYCPALTTVTLPGSVTSIGEGAFADCTALTTITLPAGLEEIGDDAFSGCDYLARIVVPTGTTAVFTDFFDDAGLDIGNAKIVEQAEIDGVIWTYCVVDGGAEIVAVSPAPSGDLTIPSSLNGYSVKKIGDAVFMGCSLTSVTIPEGVTSIGRAAFQGCGSLTTVTLPSTIDEIGERAFKYCDTLKKFNVPAGTGAAMTALLEASDLDLTGITVVESTVPAKTAAEVAAELMATATINLTGATPTITINTIPGFTYTVKEGQTLETMTLKSGEGKVKVGDGNPWTPTLQKYTGSGFYSFGVSVTE